MTPDTPARAHVSGDRRHAPDDDALGLILFWACALVGLGFVCGLALAPFLLEWLS